MDLVIGKANQLLRGKPAEAEGVKCHSCRKQLPPTVNWSEICDQELDRLIDKVKVKEFQKGVYFQVKESGSYFCSDCFWRPAKDEKRKREKEAAKANAKKITIFNKQLTIGKKKKIPDPELVHEKKVSKHCKETEKMLKRARIEREQEHKMAEKTKSECETSSQSSFSKVKSSLVARFSK